MDKDFDYVEDVLFRSNPRRAFQMPWETLFLDWHTNCVQRYSDGEIVMNKRKFFVDSDKL